MNQLGIYACFIDFATPALVKSQLFNVVALCYPLLLECYIMA